MKDAATDLAARIASGSTDAQKIEELLAQLGYSGTLPVAPAAGPVAAGPAGPARVGIWKQTHTDGKSFFERTPGSKFEWPLWANVHQLYPKGVKKRVVLLGESVARGYFYDPYYSVAAELEAILKNTRTLPGAEVIDLARTSMGLDGLRELTRECLVLQPDAVVIFAGNNWSDALNGSLGAQDRKALYDLYLHAGFPGIKAFLEQKLARIATGYLREVADTLVRKGIPVTFVIPGFNLADWQSDDTEKILSWLPDNQVSEWLAAKAAAEQARAAGDQAGLGAAAGRMVAFDPSNPLGYEWLAQHHLASGRREAAIACLEEACDTVLAGRGNNSKPRCYRAIRQALLAEAAAYGVSTVDLPAVFIDASPGKIPGRDLFLDYCHLTVAGIKIAMQHTAQVLLKQFAGPQGTPETAGTSGLEPGKRVQATAHFCAAIHNAHYGQTAGILQYHCEKAVALSPDISETMLRFADFATRYAPTMLCKTFEKVILAGNMRQYEGGRGLPHPRGRKLLDVALVDAITAAVARLGVDVGPRITQLRKKEHGVGSRPVDLLESFYHLTSYNDFIAEPKPDFMQVRTTQTRFTFIASEGASLSLDFVLRTPGRNVPGKCIKIAVNHPQHVVAKLPMSENWQTGSCTIGEELLNDGVNTLLVEWPYTFEPLAGPANGGPGGSMANALFPVLGELYTLQLSAREESALLDQPARMSTTHSAL